MEDNSKEEKEASPDVKVEYQDGQSPYYGEFKYDIDEKAIHFFRLDDLHYVKQSIKEIIQGDYYQSMSFKPPGPKDDHDKCPYHRLFMVVRPTNIEVANPEVKLEAVAEQIYSNDFNHDVIVKPALNAAVENTFESGWSQQSSKSLSEDISVGVQIKMFNIGASINATQTTSTGRSETFTQKLTISTTASAETVLFPGEKCKAIMMIYLGHAQAVITYEAKLQGTVCIATAQLGKEHHDVDGVNHYHLDVSDPRLKFNKGYGYTQSLRIGCYSNATVIVEPFPKP